MNTRPPRNWLLMPFFAAIALAIFLFLRPDTRPDAEQEKAEIGGAFTLTDSRGVSRSAKDFHGKHLLLFFGYTFCPEVCPVTLQIMSDAIERLGEDGQKVTPVFITLDPERDNREVMGRYLANFHPRFVGLTGTTEQVAVAAKAYQIYYKKAGEDEDYLLDHSALVFFMGPDGKYLAHFRQGDSAEKIAGEISRQIH